MFQSFSVVYGSMADFPGSGHVATGCMRWGRKNTQQRNGLAAVGISPLEFQQLSKKVAAFLIVAQERSGNAGLNAEPN